MKKQIKVTYTFSKNDKKLFNKRTKELNLTHKEIAQKLGISNAYINYILNGERQIGIDLVEKFISLGFVLVED